MTHIHAGSPDNSPSLRLHLDDGIWHCFGCGCSGDVVEWVRQTEAVDWRQAIRVLEAGGPLKNAWPSGAEARDRAPWMTSRAPTGFDQPEPSRTPPDRVLAALDAAWGHYTSRQLHDAGVRYLLGRRIDVCVLENHLGRAEVGLAAGTPAAVVRSLRQLGFTGDELVDAGLAARRTDDGALSDYFRQRVLLPVRDSADRICGLIGRNIGDLRFPKYKNPPRTCTYDKSANLYQPLPLSSNRRGQLVVVEGTLDAMAIAVAAIHAGRAEEFCPVTQSGRELSSVQLGRIAAFERPIVLGFDGDTAGRDSAIRHARAALQLRVAAWVTTLPADHDPASWLAQRGCRELDAWSVESGLHRSVRPISAETFLAAQGTERTVPLPALETTAAPAL